MPMVHRAGRRFPGLHASTGVARPPRRGIPAEVGAAMSIIPPRTAQATGTRKAATVAQQYGALPWRMSGEGSLQVLLVTSRRRGRWIVPKGWQAKGRSPLQTAEREAFEEAGVIGRTGPDPIGSYRYAKLRDDGTIEPCNVTIFGLHVLGTLLTWPEKGQRKRQWWPIDEARDVVGEPGLADLLGSVGSEPSVPDGVQTAASERPLGAS